MMKSLRLCLLGLAHLVAAGRLEQVNLYWPICGTDPQEVLHLIRDGNFDKIWLTDREANVTYYYPAQQAHPWSELTLYSETREKSREVSVAKIRIGPLPFKAMYIGGVYDVPEDYLEILSPYKEKCSTCAWERYYGDDRAFYSCEVSAARKGKSGLWSQDQKSFIQRWHGEVDLENLLSAGPFEKSEWDVEFDGFEGVFESVDDGDVHVLQLKVETSKAKADKDYDCVNSRLPHSSTGLEECLSQDELNWGKKLRSWPEETDDDDDSSDQ